MPDPPQTCAPPVVAPIQPSVGTLPSQYKRMSDNGNLVERKKNNRAFLLIPMLICACLLWFAWSQWNNPPQVFHQPPKAEDPTVKKRVWWMPDLLKTLPPFADGYRVEKYLPQYNLTSCSIHGNFPDLNAAIFCFLNDSHLFLSENRSISGDFLGNGSFCGNSPPLTLSTWDEWKKSLNKPVRRISIVTEPLERFARQFQKICVIEKKCYNCKDNIACFMRKLLKDHQKLAEGLQGHIRTYLTNHFSPQTWNCHFHRDLHNVNPLKLGGNETQKMEFVKNLNKIFDEQKVGKDLQEIVEKEVMKIDIKIGKEEQKIMQTIRQDEDLWRLFRYLYEHDFTIFGYNL